MINFNINLKSLNGESLLGTTDIVIPVVTTTSQLTNDSGFITSSALTGYATEDWVIAKNYLTAYNLIGYATEDWVIAKNYLTAYNLIGYATENYVDNAISALDIPESFLDLNDTPNDYTGQAGKLVAVNDTNDGLIFITPTAFTQVQSDWLQTNPSEVDFIKNKPTIPDVSNFYTKTEVDNLIDDVEDLIPTNTSDLTNDSGFITSTALTPYATKTYVDDEIDSIVIPTKTSDLTNDSGFITSTALTPYTTKIYVDGEIDSVEGQILSVSNDLTDLDNELATVAKTGSYDDLSNKPTLFDGDYNSLSNKPFIPTDIDDLTDNDNLLFDGDYNSLTNKPDLSTYATKTYVDDEIDNLVIPTKTSDLTNDSGFITSSALSPYSTTTQMNTAISNKVDKVDIVNSPITITISSCYGKFLYIPIADIVYTIPNNSTEPFEIGTRIDGFSGTGISKVQFVPASGVTLISDDNKNKIAYNTGFSLIKVDINTWVLVGKLEE